MADRIGRIIGWVIVLGVLIYAIATADREGIRALRVAGPVIAIMLFLAWLLNRKLDAILDMLRRRP